MTTLFIIVDSCRLQSTSFSGSFVKVNRVTVTVVASRRVSSPGCIYSSMQYYYYSTTYYVLYSSSTRSEVLWQLSETIETTVTVGMQRTKSRLPAFSVMRSADWRRKHVIFYDTDVTTTCLWYENNADVSARAMDNTNNTYLAIYHVAASLYLF